MEGNLGAPQVSAVMIVYNGAEFIGAAIDSIIKQTYRNWELLILNDGSTDTTESLILEYQKADHRIIYLKNNLNKGLAYSRNKVISEAKGKYIITADADDISCIKRFERQVRFMEENNDIDILGSDIELLYPGKGKKQTWTYAANDAEIKKALADSCAVANPASCFKKEVFEKINGYNEGLFICEDWDFFLRAAEQHKFYNLKDVLVKYRLHINNISKNKLEQTVLYCLYINGFIKQQNIMAPLQQILKQGGKASDFAAKKIIDIYPFWIKTYLSAGFIKLADELFLKVEKEFVAYLNEPQKKMFYNACAKIFLKNHKYSRLFKMVVSKFK